MCGLVALFGIGGASPDLPRLSLMVGTLRHRGPDDSGVLIEGSHALGFRRLSILDLSPTGHQPMRHPEAGVSIVFNGEIYNYLELRADLVALGHSFRSSGDSEVLLHAYLEWGTDCVTRLNGMWAFVIADHRRGTLFGSRDRFGIKPLYRASTSSLGGFASEIKALIAGGLVRPKPHLPVVANFLVDNRLDNTEATFFEGVFSVPAAHNFEVDRNGVYRQWRYWSLDFERPAPKDPAAEFAELFEDAMRLHMRSDVPVAVHLSGGLDSTAITCAAGRIVRDTGTTATLSAFCYMDPRFDERAYVDATLRQTAASMSPLSCTPRQLWNSLPDALRAHDEPFHSMTALVGYQLMKLTAAHGIKVVLNGQGADETLAGYGSYFRSYWQTLLARGSLGTLSTEVRDWSRANGRATLAELAGVVNRFVREALRGNRHYHAASSRRWRQRIGQQRWIAAPLRELADAPPQTDPGLLPELARSVQFDPLPIYLRVEDRNSSAHSIEGRVPFLDYRLVELAFALPPEWHMRGPYNKYILREAMRGRIPEPVRARLDKMGFPTGASQWLRDELFESAREVVNDPGFRRFDLFDGEAVAAMLDEHRAGRTESAAEVLRAVQLYLWHQARIAASAPPSERLQVAAC